jgi:hypothetical protein
LDHPLDSNIEGDALLGVTFVVSVAAADARRVQLTRRVLMMALQRTSPVRLSGTK